MASRGTDPVEESVEYRVRLVGDAVRYQAWVILLAVLVGVLLGFGASVKRPGSYVATATVLINPLAGNPYSPGVTGQDSLVSIETESKVASSDEVTDLVVKALADNGITADPTSLEKHVTVSVPSNTQIIEIAFSSGNPKLSEAAAQQYVESFLANRKTRALRLNEAQAVSLQTQLDKVGAQLDEAKGNPPSPANTALIRSLNSQSVSLQGQINTLKAADPDPGHVISPATTPSKTSGLGRPLYLIAGGLFGLVVGVMLALARQRRDDRVHHVDEVEAVDLPVIAAFGDTAEDSAEAIRMIRSRALAIKKGPALVVVGPPDGSDDWGQIAAQLAQSLSNVGRGVVFVDLAASSQPGGSAPYGFTDLLMGERTSIRDLLVESDSTLTVLPKGRADLGDAIEFLDTARLRRLIGELPRGGDFIVLHAPMLTNSVGETLMETAALTVVTTTLSRSTRSQLALLRSRGRERVVAVLTPRVKKRSLLTPWRSRGEGSKQVSRKGEALTLVDDDGNEEKSA